jgi:hypothetical protein
VMQPLDLLALAVAVVEIRAEPAATEAVAL